MMLTSDDYSTSAQACNAAGIDSYLIKPVKQSELADSMLRLLGAPHLRHAPVRPSTISSVAPARSMNVLLAEDNPVNQRVATRLLQMLGHRVTVAADGKDALAKVRDETFDVVFMDVQMPEMDGIAATQSIRRSEREARNHLPIIAMTAHAMSGDRERLLECGMDGYVSKPISLAALRQALECLLPVPEPVSAGHG